MKITETPNSIKWTPPLMTCDVPIAKSIKDPLPNMTGHFLCFCGQPGSGKTSASVSWLTNSDMYHKVFHNIFVVMPINSRNSIKNEPFKDHPGEKLFDELTIQCLEFVKGICQTESSEGFQSLLFIDDCASELKNNEIQKLLKQLVLLRRHLKLSIWIMSQSMNMIPLVLRKNLSHAVIFKPHKKELENICSELVYLPKDDQMDLANYVWDAPFNFLLLDIKNNKMYKNFNALTFE